MEVILVALIVSVIAPIMVAYLTNKQNRANKQMDWDRQDAVAREAKRQQNEVAAQAATAADLLLQAQRETASRTEEVARVAALTARDQSSQLRQIHTLVNSDMTAARQELLDQTRLLVVLYRKTLDDDKIAGRPSDSQDVKAYDDALVRVDQLQVILADRLAQQRLVEKEQAEIAATIKQEWRT